MIHSLYVFCILAGSSHSLGSPTMTLAAVRTLAFFIFVQQASTSEATSAEETVLQMIGASTTCGAANEKEARAKERARVVIEMIMVALD